MMRHNSCFPEMQFHVQQTLLLFSNVFAHILPPTTLQALDENCKAHFHVPPTIFQYKSPVK